MNITKLDKINIVLAALMAIMTIGIFVLSVVVDINFMVALVIYTTIVVPCGLGMIIIDRKIIRMEIKS
jgi:biotin transporter BioY